MYKTIIGFKKNLHFKPRICSRKPYLEPKTSIDMQFSRILLGKAHHQTKLKLLGEV